MNFHAKKSFRLFFIHFRNIRQSEKKKTYMNRNWDRSETFCQNISRVGFVAKRKWDENVHEKLESQDLNVLCLSSGSHINIRSEEFKSRKIYAGDVCCAIDDNKLARLAEKNSFCRTKTKSQLITAVKKN